MRRERIYYALASCRHFLTGSGAGEVEMICEKSGALACRGYKEVVHWGACKDAIKMETEAVGPWRREREEG